MKSEISARTYEGFPDFMYALALGNQLCTCYFLLGLENLQTTYSDTG